MRTMGSQIISLTIFYSTDYSRYRSMKTSKLPVTGLCEGYSPVTGEFPAQSASIAENVSIWRRRHANALATWQPQSQRYLSHLSEDLFYRTKNLEEYVFSSCQIWLIAALVSIYELCLPSRGRLRPRRPAQRVLFRIAVPTTTAQTV